MGCHVTDLAVALHLDEPTSHHTAHRIKVKQCEISSPEIDLITQFLGVLPEDQGLSEALPR
jgi:hypothetical protein